MTQLNTAARDELGAAGISQSAWTRAHFADGRWRGDACGCPDDRCIGRHHDADEPCGCLAVLIQGLGRLIHKRDLTEGDVR